MCGYPVLVSHVTNDVASVSALDVRRARRARRDSASAVLDATTDLLSEVAYTSVTMPAVAARCGTSVAAVTAQYLTKDALIASVYLTRLRALPLEIEVDADAVDRLKTQVQLVANIFAGSPSLGIACNIALMRNDDPAVVPVREAISTEMRRRIAASLGSGAWPEIHNTVETITCGALLQVGAGLLGYHQMIEHVETMLRLLLPDVR